MTNHEACLRFVTKIAKMRPVAVKRKLFAMVALCDEAMAILEGRAWRDDGINLNATTTVVQARLAEFAKKVRAK